MQLLPICSPCPKRELRALFYKTAEHVFWLGQRRSPLGHGCAENVILNGIPIRPSHEVDSNKQAQKSLGEKTTHLGTVGRVLVCVRGDAQSKELARYTRELADRLGTAWMATPLPDERTSRCKTPELAGIDELLQLVEALGGTVVRIPLNGRIADNLIKFAHQNNVTHIVISKSEHRRWYKYSVVRDLLHRADRIRVHIISEDDPPIGYVKPIVAPAAQSWIATLAPYLWAGTAIAAAVMVAKAIGTLVGTPRIEHVELVLLTSIVAVAVRYGLAASLLATARWRAFASTSSSCNRFTALLSTIRST